MTVTFGYCPARAKVVNERGLSVASHFCAKFLHHARRIIAEGPAEPSQLCDPVGSPVVCFLAHAPAPLEQSQCAKSDGHCLLAHRELLGEARDVLVVERARAYLRDVRPYQRGGHQK